MVFKRTRAFGACAFSYFWSVIMTVFMQSWRPISGLSSTSFVCGRSTRWAVALGLGLSRLLVFLVSPRTFKKMIHIFSKGVKIMLKPPPAIVKHWIIEPSKNQHFMFLGGGHGVWSENSGRHWAGSEGLAVEVWMVITYRSSTWFCIGYSHNTNKLWQARSMGKICVFLMTSCREVRWIFGCSHLALS